MKKILMKLAILALLAVSIVLTSCGTAVDTSKEESSATESETTENESSEGDTEATIQRLPAIHTYTSFADGQGYSKLTDYEDSDLYISVSQVADYAVFYGYSMEGYYSYEYGDDKYSKFFQEFEEDGVTVKTDYFQLLKEAIGTETFAQVDETIKGYLEKIASIYYGEGYESYWTYFCFIPEDSQEYQQLYDSKGDAKIQGYAQSDLYVSPKSVLSYAYNGYTMDQYYKWYESYGYFTVDGVDYYAQLTTAMNGELYAQVTDEIKAILKEISLAYFGNEDYWEYFCSVKTEIIPEGHYVTVTTDYYKILEEECGHDQFVQVNDTIKEALQYLSSTFYGDPQYWDYWCYTTYEVTGETPTVAYTQASGVVDEIVYINLTAANPWLKYGDTVYSVKDYQSYAQTDYDTLQSLIDAYWAEQGTDPEEYTPASEEMIDCLKGISKGIYGDEGYYYGFTYTKSGSDLTTLVGTDGEYKTVDYTDSDLYVNLDATYDYTWKYDSASYSMAQWYSYGGTYADNFIKTEVVEETSDEAAE